jgi:hypothetical protein
MRRTRSYQNSQPNIWLSTEFDATNVMKFSDQAVILTLTMLAKLVRSMKNTKVQINAVSVWTNSIRYVKTAQLLSELYAERVSVKP